MYGGGGFVARRDVPVVAGYQYSPRLALTCS